MARRTTHLHTLLFSALALASVAVLAFVLGYRTAAVDPPPSAAEREPAAVPAAPSTTRAEDRPADRLPALEPAAPIAPASPASVGVEIVRADTREPVPEAQVWWWPRSPAQGGDGDFDEWLRRGRVEQHQASATAARADHRGHVDVEADEQGFVIVASAGPLWGSASFGALREGAAVVVLAPDLDLRVQVVDAQGVPLPGIPVALRQRRGTACFERLLARTEPDGSALLHHAGHFLRPLQGQDDEFVVGVQALFDPALERALSAGALPEQPIRLVLPPSGSCAVAVVDETGESVGGAFEVQLGFGPAAGPRESRRSRGGGEVVFEHVELGRELVAEVRREGSEVLLEARGAGPRSPGQRVELRLLVESELAILRGRVLDGARSPVRERELSVRLESGDERRLWTGADGRFALQTEPRAELPAGAELALCALSPEGAPLAVARLRLPAELRAGSNELGDCVLLDLPLAAAGLVVDDDGKPVAGALVSALIGAGEPSADPLASALSDEAGRFEIRGEAAGAALWLRAEKQGLVGDAVPARAPARDLHLVLGRSGALAGRVLLEPSLQRTLLLVLAEREASAADPALEARVGSAVLAQDGSFTVGRLQPGNYSLRLVYASNATDLARVEGLAVRAGEPTRDPRLDPLDLRGKQRLLELELVDEQGLAVAGGRAFSRPSGEADARWSFAETAGTRLLLLHDGRPLDVAIAAEGFFRTELERLAESRRVTLRRAAQLRLELAGGIELPEPPLYLGVELTPLDAGRSAGFVESRQAFFGPDGVLSCASACAGALRVEFVVEKRAPGQAQLVRAGEALPRILQVAPHSAVQYFSVQADRAALAAAIEAARSGG